MSISSFNVNQFVKKILKGEGVLTISKICPLNNNDMLTLKLSSAILLSNFCS